MKKVIFDGYLKELYPNGIELEANSPAEAVGLLANYPGFRESDGVQHRVHMPDFPSKDAFYQPTDKSELLIVPFEKERLTEFEGAGGGKSGAWIQIIVGVVLMVVSEGAYGQQIFAAGLALALGGAMQLLMPQPPKVTNTTDEKSNYLAANKNTVAVGTTIGLLLGRHKVYGHMLSFNVTATNMREPALIPASPVAEAVSNDGVIEYGSGGWGDGA